MAPDLHQAEVPGVAHLSELGVIRAKILPRRVPGGAIPRPALVDRLRSGRGSTLTLLSAPAGFGKTTLLAEWVADPGTPRCAWVSLDRRDSDPTRLWTHLIAALSGVEPRAGTASLAALRGGPDQIEGHVLPLLLEELAGDGPDLVVILDDYHLARNVAVDAAVGAFMQYRPTRVQLVISTRANPPLGVARLRASGELTEIRAADLRFDEGEIAAFIAQVAGVELSPEEAASLAGRTGGWPAPLRLLALLIREHEPGVFIESFTVGHRPVVEYLTKDVIELLEPDVQDFVQRVSILTRMCGPLCDAVVGRTGSGAILAELERANLFVSVDTAGDWYSQHHLLSAAMRLEVSRSHAELLPILHRRAAAWFEGAGDLESAIDHAIEGHDLDVARRLLAVQFEPLATRGRWATLRGWMADLSWPAALADPQLAFIRATADAFSHDIEGAERWLDLASKGPPGDVGAMGLPLGYRTDFMRAVVGVNDVARGEDAALRALESAAAPRWEGVALAGLGQAQYLRGSSAEARDTLHKAVALIPDSLPNLLAFAIGNLALAEYADHAPAHAGHMLEGAIEMLRTTGQLGSPWGAILHMALGERARTAGDPRAASAWFDQAIDMLGEGKRSAWLANAYLLYAANSRALGDTAGTVRLLDAADAVLDRLPDPGNLPARSERLRKEASSVGPRHTEFGEELSDREVAVLRLAGDGLTQRQIANQLFISYNTVKSHLKSAYRKLGATSRDDALSRLADLTPSPQALPPQ